MRVKTLEEKLALISLRWPEIGRKLSAKMADQRSVTGDTPVISLVHKGIHLSSVFDPIGEAIIQASVVDENSQTVWGYGVGSGYLADQLLLRPALKALYLVFFNHQLLVESLAIYPHGWLQDPRVTLVYAGHIKQMAHPAAAVYSELILAESSSHILRDQVVMALNERIVRIRLERRQARYDRPNIMQNVTLALKDSSVGELFNQKRNSVITVVAGGPSASQFLNRPVLSDCLIVVSTALKAVLLAGLKPEFVIALDGHPGMISHIEDILKVPELKKTTLVYTPAIPPEMLTIWPGRRKVFRIDSQLYQCDQRCEVLTPLFCSGTVTHSAIDLAVKMGAREVRLVGTDFGFPDGYTHLVDSSKRKQAKGLVEIKSACGKLIKSTPALVAYLRDLESYIAMNRQVNFVSMSRAGAYMDGVSYYEDEKSV